MSRDLLDRLEQGPAGEMALGPGAVLLPGLALAEERALIEQVEALARAAPFRHLATPGGGRMSVAMTNCGPLGWHSDRRGYRYEPVDPQTGQPWPAMPQRFRELAVQAAARAGHAGFAPDACLVNRYETGARMALHQDHDERDGSAPIVSVSLGAPAVFLWGGAARGDRPRRLALESGDVVVWGGPSRFTFHGVAPVRRADHPLTGTLRYNLTFRRAG